MEWYTGIKTLGIYKQKVGLQNKAFISINETNFLLFFNRNSPCNTLQGSYDGILFPRNISKTEVFNVYRKTFCRNLPIQFSHEARIYGYDGYWFKLADNAFDSYNDDPASSCYCDNKQCLKKGLGNISPCYYSKCFFYFSTLIL